MGGGSQEKDFFMRGQVQKGACRAHRRFPHRRAGTRFSEKYASTVAKPKAGKSIFFYQDERKSGKGMFVRSQGKKKRVQGGRKEGRKEVTGKIRQSV